MDYNKKIEETYLALYETDDIEYLNIMALPNVIRIIYFQNRIDNFNFIFNKKRYLRIMHYLKNSVWETFSGDSCWVPYLDPVYINFEIDLIIEKMNHDVLSVKKIELHNFENEIWKFTRYLQQCDNYSNDGLYLVNSGNYGCIYDYHVIDYLKNNQINIKKLLSNCNDFFEFGNAAIPFEDRIYPDRRDEYECEFDAM